MPPKEKRKKMADENPCDSSSSKEEKFTFFWKQHSPFSQFHPATFHGPPLFIRTEEDKKGYTFLHCEQWMMFNKAKLFNDEESATKILATSAPPSCKALGRKVKNFDEKVWKQHNKEIIREGNRLKFTQNPKLLKELLKTEGTTLAEASPYDTLYGIGLSADNPKALNRSTWRGKNLLGDVLTELRNELKMEEDGEVDSNTSSTNECQNVVVGSLKYAVHDAIDREFSNDS